MSWIRVVKQQGAVGQDRAAEDVDVIAAQAGVGPCQLLCRACQFRLTVAANDVRSACSLGVDDINSSIAGRKNVDGGRPNVVVAVGTVRTEIHD